MKKNTFRPPRPIYAFTQKHFWDAESKTMYHRWRGGERDSVQLLDAYAFQLDGTLHLYEATLQAKYLEQAVALADRMIELFTIRRTADLARHRQHRPHHARQGRLRWSHAFGQFRSLIGAAQTPKITERKQYRTCAERTLKLFAERMEKPAAPCRICCRPWIFTYTNLPGGGRRQPGGSRLPKSPA